MKRLLLVELVAVATLTAVAALGFHRVFAGRSFLVPVLGAAALPVVLSALTRLRRCRFLTSLLVSIAGFVVYAIYAVLGDTAPNLLPTATTFRELSRGLTNGWADLLSISLPARAEPRLLVVACAVVWLGAFLGAELAQRSRNVVAPAVPPLAAYGYTLLYAAGQPRSSLVVPIAITGATLLLVLVHANRWAAIEPGGLRVRVGEDEDAEASMQVSADRRVLIGLPVIAAGLVVAAVASALPTNALRSSFDPRQYRSQDVVARDVVSPLADVRRQLHYDPPLPLFTINIERLSDALLVPRIRLATLDRFDGASWSASGEFARVGSALPDVPDLAVPEHEVRQTYTIDGLQGPWLPAAERPAAVQTGNQPLEIQFDAGTGNLITDRQDLKGVTYGVSSIVTNPSPDELQRLQAGTGKEFAETTSTQGMPKELRALAASFTANATTTYAQLEALQNTLRQNYGYSEDVPPGQSYGRILSFLTQTRLGYAEQFASAFAVLARALGIPSRLSVGYLSSVDSKPGQPQVITDGVITTRQVHVWPEVYLEGAGWVPFDPTPPRVSKEPPKPPTEEPVVQGGGVVDASQQPSQLPNPDRTNTDEHHGNGLSNRVLALVALAALLLSLPLSLIALKALVRRRRRKRARTPAQQVLNAWAEVVDRLLEVGVPLRRSMTPREVAGGSIEFVSSAASALLYQMVPLVSAALFAPSGPSQERAWQMRALADAFERELLAGRTVPGRVAAALSPRPLLYSRR